MPEPTHPSADLGEDKDGRTVRRDRNAQLAVNATRELFEETMRVPTIEEVSIRSGLSVRSMYRYFADIQELSDEVVRLVQDEARAVSTLPDPAGISLADRVEAIARLRVSLYEVVKGTFLANAARVIVSGEPQPAGAAIRAQMLRQFSNQFAQELLPLDETERRCAIESGHALCTMEFVDILMRWRHMTSDEAVETIKYGLTKILTAV